VFVLRLTVDASNIDITHRRPKGLPRHGTASQIDTQSRKNSLNSAHPQLHILGVVDHQFFEHHGVEAVAALHQEALDSIPKSSPYYNDIQRAVGDEKVFVVPSKSSGARDDISILV